MSNSITTIPHKDSGKVRKTSGDSGLTASAGKSAEKLPEEIIERIMSRIPFPSLFKAKLLSKTWCSKFPRGSQLTESSSPFISLQNLASSTSFKWPTYCPLYVSHEAILGFDRTSTRWQTMMDVSYLPISTWSFVTCVGPLICLTKGGINRDLEADVEEYLDVFVTNPITRDWRKLEFPLRDGKPVVLKIIMQGSHAYQVLMVSEPETGRMETRLCSHVYDSSRRTYKRNTFEIPGLYDMRIFPATVYLDGNLYCMSSSFTSKVVDLWMYNVKNNVLSSIARFPKVLYPNVSDCGALLCGDKVMVVVFPVRENDFDFDDDNIMKGSIQIFELDALQLKPVSGGPPEVVSGRDELMYAHLEKERMQFASDSDCIYFQIGQTFPGSPMFSYNVRSNEWTRLPRLHFPRPAGYDLTSEDVNWTTVPFQPGLCPFVMV